MTAISKRAATHQDGGLLYVVRLDAYFLYAGRFDAYIYTRLRFTLTEPDQWELVFEDYILYQVRNESFCSFHAEEIRTGKYLAVYERSRLLEYLPAAVDAGLLEHTQPWKHYGIFTQNQIIDVIAQADPVISCMEA